jgi:hypothetical protein
VASSHEIDTEEHGRHETYGIEIPNLSNKRFVLEGSGGPNYVNM